MVDVITKGHDSIPMPPEYDRRFPVCLLLKKLSEKVDLFDRYETRSGGS